MLKDAKIVKLGTESGREKMKVPLQLVISTDVK